jgi:hypothetical protein
VVIAKTTELPAARRVGMSRRSRNHVCLSTSQMLCHQRFVVAFWRPWKS